MIITQTPLRISFAGGGTDFKEFYSHEEGWVVSSAIDKYVLVIVKERFDDKIYINYSKKEIVDYVDEIEHELVREAMKKTGVEKGVEITTLADIPSEGSGLGSSSSVTVGLLNALHLWTGEPQPPRVLAEEACEIEIDLCKKPIGRQDQYIAAFGGIRFFRFKSDGRVEVEKVCLNGTESRRRLGANVLLFYTDQTRRSDPILAEQRENIAGKFPILQRMKQQALEVHKYLVQDQLDKVGEVLAETWELKKQLASGISDGEIDTMYEKAMKSGALGGKICGAGGGGFLMVYVPREKQNAVREALRGYREFPFMLERDGSKVIFDNRRYDLK